MGDRPQSDHPHGHTITHGHVHSIFAQFGTKSITEMTGIYGHIVELHEALKYLQQNQ